MLGQSAHFSNEREQPSKQSNEFKFGGIKRFKVTKKSTVKSIGLVSEDMSDDDVKEKQKSFEPFGGILNSSEIKFGMPESDE